MERGWIKPNVEVSPACPRCGSSNTKFCYYNNYSLTQPRYFCKGCRRYWTKGGSLRNVPIGGGCRKSRRGKSSIRVPTDGGVSSRSLPHHGIESSGSILSGPDHASTSTNIDLAAVYANFLNQTPARAENNRVEAPSVCEGIVNINPSMEFSGFQGLHMNHHQLSASHLVPQESGLFDYGLLPLPRLPENSMFFGHGLDGFHEKQQQINTITGNGLINNMINPMENSILPPLPGEDIAGSDGILWPGPDLILPNDQILPSSTDDHETEGGQNSGLLDGNVIPFGALNLEAIFRS